MKESSRKNRLMIIWSVLTAILIALFWFIYWFITKTMPVAETPYLPHLPRYVDILIGPIGSIMIVILIFAIKAKSKEDEEAKSEKDEENIFFLSLGAIFTACLWVIFFIFYSILKDSGSINFISVMAIIVYLAINIVQGFKQKKIIFYSDIISVSFAFIGVGLVYGLVFGLFVCVQVLFSCLALTFIGSYIGAFFRSKFWTRLINFLLAR